jgi:hypothetical protein
MKGKPINAAIYKALVHLDQILHPLRARGQDRHAEFLEPETLGVNAEHVR